MKEDTAINIKLFKELQEWLDAEAGRQHRSRSNLIVHLLAGISGIPLPPRAPAKGRRKAQKPVVPDAAPAIAPAEPIEDDPFGPDEVGTGVAGG